MDIVSENANFKVDSAGRVVIPVHLRKKYGINSGDRVECYTIEANGEIYIAFKKLEG